MAEKNNFAMICIAILGLVTVAFGLADILVSAGGDGTGLSILEIPGDMFRGGWGGLIVLFAGLFYLSGCKNVAEVHNASKVAIGSVLIWIMAGTDIFAMITESIPGGEDGPWFNSLSGFLGTYAPPYAPAIFLLPFSLVVVYYILKQERAR
ncbi:MAG: hypothetical protein ANIMEMIM_00192 [Candidatus Argoarchaeum ethanivorans]|uniref:Uncharacterized protein n=1 Tax=Candidatus Argoarchaeum ethanivorans TaxID=2608793 RepID=A0A811T826_9EURY|nr:MAG: hypothetical protein ANIMEMIM_00192 [Candidatus Argoarchaeum ethanivorans]